MMSPDVRIRSIAEVLDSLPAAETSWLADSEQAVAASFSSPQRRREWLAARWLAKQMVRSPAASTEFDGEHLPLVEIVIRSQDACGRGHAPRVCVGGRAWRGCLSLSHAEGWVAAAAMANRDGRVGVDIAPALSASSGWSQWLTGSERTTIRGDDSLLNSIWCAKEAAYKATNRGEAFRPAGIEVRRELAGVWTARRLDRPRAPAVRVQTFPLPGGTGVWAVGFSEAGRSAT